MITVNIWLNNFTNVHQQVNTIDEANAVIAAFAKCGVFANIL